MPPQIAVVRVSAKAGHIRAVRVMEKRHDGWLRGVPTTETTATTPSHRRGGTWYAPHNVISLHEETKSYDYNGIQPGELVEYWDSHPAIIVSRQGAQYEVVDPVSGETRLVPWEGVVPVMQTSEVMNVA
jgi:hypothetical protein